MIMMRTKTAILPVDPVSPDKNTISRGAALVRQGGLIVFPTNTFYGLGAMAYNLDAVSKVFKVKKRDPGKPLLVLIASAAELSALVQEIPPVAEKLIHAFWSGKLTLVFKARSVLPESLSGNTGKIGVRQAGHPVPAALVKACGCPITGTSANLAGRGGCTKISALDRAIVESVDCVLDGGALKGTMGSTVVDVTVFPPIILREGVVSATAVGAVSRGE